LNRKIFFKKNFALLFQGKFCAKMPLSAFCIKVILNFKYKKLLMKQKLLISALLCTACISASAQGPTLTASTNNPVIGDQFISINSDTAHISQGAAGANITWDFSTALDSISSDTGTAVTPNSTSGYGTGYFSASTFAVATGASASVAYYSATSAKLSQDGLYLPASLSAVTYSDPMDVLQYPMSYGSSFTDTYAGNIYYSSLTPIASHGSVTVVADGYGILKLPHGNTHSNVLRTHTSQQYIDSANLFGTGVADTFQVETYTWYEPNYHTALLTIATGTSPSGNFKQVSYEYKQTAASVPVVGPLQNTLQIFPNPTTGAINILYAADAGEHGTMTLCDMTGRTIFTISRDITAGQQTISYNTTSLAKGNYIIKLSTNKQTAAQKITVE
jgi:Secretion system C-terminal sorting domain